MQGNRVLILSVALCLGAVAASVAEERPSTFAPADARTASIEIAGEPAHYEGAASSGGELDAIVACSETRPRKIDVTLRWDVDGAAADRVRVDISRFGRGFANGIYLTSGALPAGASEAFFAEAEPGIHYYWRLLTRGPAAGADGWNVAAHGRFEAPVCPFDEVAQ